MLKATFKPILTVSFFILCCCIIKAQSPGAIQFFQNNTGATIFSYEPPSRLALPTSVFVSVVFREKEDYFVIRKPLYPKNGKYHFTLSLPDSVKSFIATITDDQQKTVDNNNDTGYTVLCNKMPATKAEAQIEAAYLLSAYAPYALTLDRRVIQNKLVSLYQDAFTSKPATAENQQAFRYYLSLRNQQYGEKETPAILVYAKKMEAANDETSLVTALYIYRFLKMDNKVKELEERSIKDYPTGEVARESFINEFYERAGKNDGSTDSNLLAANYLLQRAMTILEQEKSTKHPSPDDHTLQRAYNKVLTTHAQLLFMRGQFDSAFYYQSAIVNKFYNPGSSPDAIVQWVTYAVKAKGDKYARSLALEQVKKGNHSQELLQLLQQLNQRLGIRETDNSLLPLGESVYAAQKMTAAIKRRFGSTFANNFELPDLKDDNISLAILKNKIIVLEFWATWCGPCKASFPHMQQLVKKYEKDSSVVFLFIDTYENKSQEQMKAGVVRFLSDNRYDLQILLDHENKAVNTYKVDFIPETFVIDRNGMISYMGNDNSNIVAEIEKARQLKP